MMKFKVGDRVRLLWSCAGNDGKAGVISEDDGSVIPYKVTFNDGEVEWKHADHIMKLEKTSVKFKVGDRVQVVAAYSAFCGDKGNVIDNDGTDILPIKVSFDGGEHECWFYEDDLQALHEEETSMKFKVGDKVKVKDSWFEHDGQVGVVVRIDNYEPYNYSVKFDVEGDNERYDEHFRGDSLELVTQSFTKSDLKTGMGVVLRNGDKGHVLIGTDDGDVMRFIEKDAWDTLDSANDDLTWKGMNNFDIVEVYSTKLSSRYLTDKVFEELCVFKREMPTTKMTMKEINEHFGKVIEIIE